MVFSLIDLLSVILITAILFYFFRWPELYKNAIYILSFFFFLSQGSFYFFKKKNYNVILNNESLVINKGKIFKTQILVFYSKIYSLEKKENILSKYFDTYSVTFKTIDIEFNVAGISKKNQEVISDFVEQRIKK